MSLYAISHILILLLFAQAIISLSLFKKGLSTNFYLILSIFAFMLNFFIVISFNTPINEFNGAVIINKTSINALITLDILGLITLFCALIRSSEFDPEFSSFFLLIIACAQMIFCTNNLALIFISLMLLDVLYITLIIYKSSSNIVLLKFININVFLMCVFSFGLALIYFQTNSLEIDEVAIKVCENGDPLSYSSLILIIGYLFFRLSLIPFNWQFVRIIKNLDPLLCIIKCSILNFIAIFLIYKFLNNTTNFSNVLYFMTILSLIFSSILSLIQRSLKKILAYSTISNLSNALCFILIGSNFINVCIYWLMFSLPLIGIFLILFANKKVDIKIDKISYLKSNLIVSLSLVTMFLSLSFLAPLNIFWIKFYLLFFMIKNNFLFLSTIVALSSAPFVFLYLKIIASLLFNKLAIKNDIKPNNFTLALLILITSFCIGSFLMINILPS